MGNVVGGGYASSAPEAGTAAGDEYVARLSDAEIKRYSEGYHRICRAESGGGSSAGDSSPLAVRGRRAGAVSPSASSPSAAIASAFLPKRSGHAHAAASAAAGSSPASAAATVGAAHALNGGGGVVTKKLFRSKVLGAFSMIPHSLSDRLFEVLDTERTGELTLDNVLSGIAWLKHGTFEEQVRLLFIIYDLDGAGRVARDVVDRFMDVIYGRKRARHHTTVAFLDDVFGGCASLSLDEFREVVQRKDARGDALLVKWLAALAAKIGTEDDTDILELERKYNPVVIRHRIADATQFTVSEVAALERQFQRLFDAKSGASARVPSDQFVAVLSEQNFPEKLLARFAVATALPQVVTFDEFCQFVSDFCRGTRGAKMRHLFRMYKEPDSGRVPLDAIEEIIHIGAQCDSGDSGSESDQSQRALDEEQQLAEISASVTADEGWDEESFLEWAAEARSPERLVHQLAFATCLLVGVKPATPYLEKRIVTWHWKQAAQSFTVGQSWNLMAAEWWRKWSDYVGMDPLVGTPYGSLAIPRIPPGTRVVAPPRNAVRLHAVSMAMNVERPGPVYNWTLLRVSGSRRLKDALVLGSDYYLIPSTVHSVLVQWYSGGPDLSRVVVGSLPRSVQSATPSTSHGDDEKTEKDADENVAIELFPLVLRVARVDAATGGVVMSGEEVVLSRLSTAGSLLEATCRAFLLLKMMDKARLWYFNEGTPERKVRVRSDNPRDLAKLTQDSVFLLEIQDEDGSWPLSQATDKHATSTTGTGAPGASSRRSPASWQDDSDSDEDDDDDDDEESPSAGRASGANGHPQQKRPRDARPSLRTSEFCARGNLEVLTALGSSYVSPSSSHRAQNHRQQDAGRQDGITTDGVNDSATSGVDAELAGASITVRKRFSKDAFKGQGLVGLDNLGNTCYMSSALQCLSHTRLLVEFFKHEAYLRDINLRNRDGTNGKLAVAFGELLRVLWTSEKKRFSPNEFKRVLSKCHPQFVGSDQHDAQELLACLLSSLSEDLNRIVTKPYTEQPDSNGRNDALVANEWWENHLKREVSVIVALFTGQYKSLLECSTCGYESARFEPFTFLQLSLPESNFRSVVMTLIFRTDRVPMRYSVRVRTSDTVQNVKQRVAEFFVELERSGKDGITDGEGIAESPPQPEIVLARISSFHTIDFLLDGALPLSQIPERDQLCAFELDRMEEARPSVNDKGEAPISTALPVAITSDSGPENAVDGHANGSDANRLTTETAANGNKTDGDVDSDTSSDGSDTEVLPVGTSVYVRIDKSKDLAAARVVGSSANNGTINVAYPSGARRYHIPLSKVVERRQREAFIFLVHRRVERSTNSFTNAHITRLFGAPLVLRVSLRETTAYNLYMLVWKRLRRIFNWQEPPPPFTSSDLASEDGHTSESSLRTDTSCLALGRHLAMTRFGFCLRMVTSHGVGCSRCEWIDGCLGCLIVPSSSTPIDLAAEETVAIDWDIRSLKEDYDPIQASKLDFDDSVLANRRQDNMPLNLNHCLEIFTAKENIQEAFCGRCRALRPATKKMDLWRLPPLLVIQLKRFCYTQVSRRKLHHLVDFPLKGLNLQAYLAKMREANTKQRNTGLEFWLFLGGKLQRKETPADHYDGGDEQLNGHASSEATASTESSNSNGDLRHAQVVSALESPAIAALTDLDKVDALLYDLYAVVNHVGALGGGHYFAYVLSETDGKWKCFNDHQCKDVDENEVVSSTAYILFYRRRDVANVPIEHLFPPQAARRVHTSSDDKKAAAHDQQQVEELLEQSKLSANGGGSSCTIS